MKEASGELNMTLITIIAIAAIAGLFVTVFLPMIQKSIEDKWDSTTTGYVINENDNELM